MSGDPHPAAGTPSRGQYQPPEDRGRLHGARKLVFALAPGCAMRDEPCCGQRAFRARHPFAAGLRRRRELLGYSLSEAGVSAIEGGH